MCVFTPLQAGVSGVEIISSARMCEVFIGEAVGGAIRPSYVCTVKASPVCTVDDELIIDTSVFKLEHCPAVRAAMRLEKQLSINSYSFTAFWDVWYLP